MKKQILLTFTLCIIHNIFGNNHEAKNAFNRGVSAFQQKRSTHALKEFEKAITLDQNYDDAHFYKAVTLYYANKPSEACDAFAECLKANPHHKKTLESYPIVLNHAGYFKKARDMLEAIRDEDPRNTTAITKLLPIYLRSTDWYYALKLCRINDLWWYDKELINKRVLLDLSSQWNGLGDVMQIVRYARHIKLCGTQVYVKTRKEMVPLLSLCPYLDKVITPDQAVPAHDITYELTTDRCMLCMRDTLHAPSSDVPYLFADDALVEKWNMRLWPDRAFKVGITWQSTKMKDYFTGTILPGPRAITLNQLKPLLTSLNASFYSLQLGENTEIEKIRKQNVPICTFDNLDQEHGPFMDTAAIMKNLDLVITVDTSIAHLAGAMGIPVWLMLPYAADFRWFSDRDDSPLYPTMRLFRQPQYGDWNSVVLDVKNALLEKTKQH